MLQSIFHKRAYCQITGDHNSSKFCRKKRTKNISSGGDIQWRLFLKGTLKKTTFVQFHRCSYARETRCSENEGRNGLGLINELLNR